MAPVEGEMTWKQ